MPGAALPHKPSYSWIQDSRSTLRLHWFTTAYEEGIYRPRSGIHRPSPPIDSTWQPPGEKHKAVKASQKKWPHVNLQCTRTAYPKEYSNTMWPMTAQYSTTQRPTTTYHWQITWEYDKWTLYSSSFFTKEPGYRLRGCRVPILMREFQFFSSEDSRPFNFLF
jgi:hypothetical protein